MRIIKIHIVILFFLLLASSCLEWKEKSVTITKDYVINPYWDKVDNSFDVIRMKLKNRYDTFDLKKITSSKLLQKLEQDTSLIYRASVDFNGVDYYERKVYFNRNNGFLWWSDLHKSNSAKKVLGKLQQETWYLLLGLGRPRTLYYVYLDSRDSLHTFKVPASSWTNF